MILRASNGHHHHGHACVEYIFGLFLFQQKQLIIIHSKHACLWWWALMTNHNEFDVMVFVMWGIKIFLYKWYEDTWVVPKLRTDSLSDRFGLGGMIHKIGQSSINQGGWDPTLPVSMVCTNKLYFSMLVALNTIYLVMFSNSLGRFISFFFFFFLEITFTWNFFFRNWTLINEMNLCRYFIIQKLWEGNSRYRHIWEELLP